METLVRQLYYSNYTVTEIADLLKVTRKHVYKILKLK